MSYYYLYNPDNGEYRSYSSFQEADCILSQLGDSWEGVYSARQLSERLHEKKQRQQESITSRVLRNAA